MQAFRTFDIMGPRMIGPSSSHTAGAARLAHTAWMIAGRNITQATMILYGSFATTGAGHGTDKALLAGVLGLAPDDARLRYSRLLAQEAELEYSFEYEPTPPGDYANMARVILTGADGRVTDVLGASIGGGNIRITELNGMAVDFTGEYPALIVSHTDAPGVISAATGVLAQHNINIAAMRVYRDGKGQKAYMVIETDTPISETLCAAVRAIPGVNRARAIDVE